MFCFMVTHILRVRDILATRWVRGGRVRTREGGIQGDTSKDVLVQEP
jgi:hypothetical protein